jgi:hypothetical protein
MTMSAELLEPPSLSQREPEILRMLRLERDNARKDLAVVVKERDAALADAREAHRDIDRLGREIAAMHKNLTSVAKGNPPVANVMQRSHATRSDEERLKALTEFTKHIIQTFTMPVGDTMMRERLNKCIEDIDVPIEIMKGAHEALGLPFFYHLVIAGTAVVGVTYSGSTVAESATMHVPIDEATYKTIRNEEAKRNEGSPFAASN